MDNDNKVSQKEFVPYIPADKVVPEFTILSIITGAVMAIIFGAANAYLGLKVGMTISASIPAAVISMGVMRFVFKRNSILENNMVQTVASAGEAVAAGAIFTLPVLFMWNAEGKCDAPSIITVGLISFCGGILGILMMIPLRNALIVQEHGTLEYPEGVACSKVLMAGEQGGSKTAPVFAGLGFSALFKFLADGTKIFPSTMSWDIPQYKGSAVGVSTLPALVGVGYICNIKVAAKLFAGGILSWLVLMPMIVFFGSNSVVFPSTVTISELFTQEGAQGIWSSYIRYIGAGALIAGGVISLVKSLPMIAKTFSSAFKSYGKGKAKTLKRTDQDISLVTVLIVSLIVTAFLWLCPLVPINLGGALMTLFFSFFFATVASRIVGVIGASNNPASGMTIATLLITSLILKLTGMIDINGMIMALSISAVIATVVCLAADTSQDLKTGFLLGSTPKKQQIGEMFGVFFTAIAVGAILYLLNSAWGFGSAEIPAPQATMMKMIIEGIMSGNLPWIMIIIGICIAIVLEFLSIPILSVAIGIYLPITTTAGIFFGGLMRWIVEKRKYKNEEDKEEAVQSGVLYTSGLIAGEGLIGILLALFAIITINGKPLADIVNLSSIINLGNIGGLVFFAILLLSILFFASKGVKKSSKNKE